MADKDFQIKSTSESPSTSKAEDVQQFKIEKDSLETRAGQLEVKIDTLKERIDGHLELRKWLLIATLTIIGLAIATGTFVFNIFKDSQDSYRNLQDSYYKELIELRKEIPIPQSSNANSSIKKENDLNK